MGRKLFSRSFLSPFQMRTAKGQPAGANEKGKMNMKPQNLVHILIVIVCIGLLSNAQAVNPAPDGFYPGFNTAEGQNALLSLDVTNGFANTAVGWFSLSSNIEGDFNTATGVGALLFNTADQNTAFGAAALLFNTIGAQNTAVGAAALLNNTEGDNNTATGAGALSSNTNGGFNTAYGARALSSKTIGGSNIALGFGAGGILTMGDNNIYIGNVGEATESDTIHIGSGQTKTFIAGIRGTTTGVADAIPVLIDDLGQLGTLSSARRFKKEIKPMDGASESILALKPVRFHYKTDTTNTPQFGLVAEEVAEVNPDLVVRDKNGEIYTVRYDAVNAMLLNEFLKQHGTVQELKSAAAKQNATITDLNSTVTQQQNEIRALTASVKEQAAQIQKVSAQIAVSKGRPQMAGNQ
jgi:uncharacterized coiled-coil protein SlyX